MIVSSWQLKLKFELDVPRKQEHFISSSLLKEIGKCTRLTSPHPARPFCEYCIPCRQVIPGTRPHSWKGRRSAAAKLNLLSHSSSAEKRGSASKTSRRQAAGGCQDQVPNHSIEADVSVAYLERSNTTLQNSVLPFKGKIL